MSVCLSQGDRGFDGLPGLPGDKGHRVSEQRNNHSTTYSQQNKIWIVVQYVRKLELLVEY